MRSTAAAAFSLALLIPHEGAAAQDLFGFLTVEDYLRASIEKQVGYTAGLFDALLWTLAEADDGRAVRIAECLSEETDTGLSLIYDAYLESNPDMQDWSAAEAFQQMLAERCIPDPPASSAAADSAEPPPRQVR